MWDLVVRDGGGWGGGGVVNMTGDWEEQREWG